eukprot:3190615-Prymnesium_polylepis.1
MNINQYAAPREPRLGGARWLEAPEEPRGGLVARGAHPHARPRLNSSVDGGEDLRIGKVVLAVHELAVRVVREENVDLDAAGRLARVLVLAVEG